MNEKTTRVFKGWLELTDDERRLLSDAIRQYSEKTSSGKQVLKEEVRASVTKMQTGPLGPTCPCCGR